MQLQASNFNPFMLIYAKVIKITKVILSSDCRVSKMNGLVNDVRQHLENDKSPSLRFSIKMPF